MMSKTVVKYKILYIDSVSVISGAEMSLLLLLSNLNREKFEPLVILPERGMLCDRIQALDIDLKLLPLNKINIRNPIPYLKTVWSLVKILRRHKIDLLHCNMDICNQYSMIAAKLVGIPVITHTRNILGKRAFQRMFLRGADVLIANSRAVADSYSRYVTKGQKVENIYNGVDLNHFRPEGRGKSRSRFGISDDEFVVGQIARIDTSKGQDVLIKAMAQVLQTHPNVRTLIVGDIVIDDSKFFLEKLKKLVSELGLKEKIIFTGFLKDIVDLYSALDLVVVASKAEPFGRTIIEAMSMAKPVVATNSGGPVEIVEEGKTGFLVPYGYPEVLARAIIKLIDDAHLASEFGINSRQRVADYFSIENNVRKTEQVYMSLLVD